VPARYKAPKVSASRHRLFFLFGDNRERIRHHGRWSGWAIFGDRRSLWHYLRRSLRHPGSNGLGRAGAGAGGIARSLSEPASMRWQSGLRSALGEGVAHDFRERRGDAIDLRVGGGGCFSLGEGVEERCANAGHVLSLAAADICRQSLRNFTDSTGGQDAGRFHVTV